MSIYIALRLDYVNFSGQNPFSVSTIDFPIFLRFLGLIHSFSEIVYDFIPKCLWITNFLLLLKFQCVCLSSVIFWLLFSTVFWVYEVSSCKNQSNADFKPFSAVFAPFGVATIKSHFSGSLFLFLYKICESRYGKSHGSFNKLVTVLWIIYHLKPS